MKIVSIFKALSDETRLRLVHLSMHYELNVNEIVSILGMGQSRISRHLKILTECNLLTYRKDGLWTFYSAATEGEGYTFIQSIRYLFDKDRIFQDDIHHAKRLLEEQEIEKVRFFDAIAEDWEKLKREIIGDVNLNGMILENIRRPGVIADLGCGTGDLLDALKQKATRVIGVEKSPKMLESARRRFSADKGNVELRIGELEHLPIREEEADMAIINMVLHHLPEPIRAIKEASRILKKGDTFIIVDLVTHQQESMRERFGDRWLGFAVTDIQKWLESGDFKPETTHYFDLKKGLKGFLIQSCKI